MIPTVHAGDDFDGLLAYLQKPGHSLVEPVASAVEQLVEQMKMVADLSARCSKPVKHLTFSAAKEDGRLDDATWVGLVDEAERELGLEGHLRVIVRHSDKGYDHVHVFWCTVSATTGQTPTRRWFRIAKTEHLPDIGPRALTPKQVAKIPANARRLKSYDAHALTRLQYLCREFERRAELRELASPAAAGQARQNGNGTQRNREQEHRRNRIGDSLTDKAIEIRTALEPSTYVERAARLHELGLGMRAAVQRMKTGEERLRGVLIFDLGNPANAVPASHFDLPGTKFGLGALDSRTATDTPRFAEWIERYIAPDATSLPAANTEVRKQYDRRRAAHREEERSNREHRQEAHARHERERRVLRENLMVKRNGLAKRVPPAERRAIYASFDADVRAPALSKLAVRQRGELEEFKRRRFPTFAKWKQIMLIAARKLPLLSIGTAEEPTTLLQRDLPLQRTPALRSPGPEGTLPTRSRSTLRDQAVTLAQTHLRDLRVFAKGKSAVSSVPSQPSSVPGVIARFELEVQPDDRSVHAPASIAGFSPFVKGDVVEYRAPGRPLAFVDRGSSIDVLLDADDVLRAVVTLAKSRGTRSFHIHASPSVIERVRRLTERRGSSTRNAIAADIGDVRKAQRTDTAAGQSVGTGSAQSRASATPIAAGADRPKPSPGIRSIAKGPRSVDVPGLPGTSRDDERGR